AGRLLAAPAAMHMKVHLAPAGESLGRSELVVGFAYDGVPPHLGEKLEEFVRAARGTGDVSVAERAWRLFHRPAGSRGLPKRLGLLGMGKRSKVDTEALRRAVAVVQARAEAVGVPAFDLWIAPDDCGDVAPFDAGAAIAEGLVLGSYRYAPPRKEKPKPRKAQTATVRFAGSGAVKTAF